MDWLHYNYYSRKVSNRSKISFQNYTLPSSRSSFPPPPPPSGTKFEIGEQQICQSVCQIESLAGPVVKDQGVV